MTEQYDDRPERAFRDALSQRAEVFEPADLDLTGARRRAPWRAWGAAAAAAVLIAGTAGGVAWWQGDDRSAAEPNDQSVGDSLPPPDPGWRYESYRDVVVQVPDSWGYRPASRCATRPDTKGPFVETPMDVIDLMACMNESPLGMDDWATYVSFSPPAAFDPDPAPIGPATEGGWTRIVTVIGQARIEVLADEDHLADAQRLVDSARVVTHDHNGCAATSPIQQGHYVSPAQPFDVMAVDTVDRIALCWYDLDTPDRDWPGGLRASRLLSGTAAQAELEAIQDGSPGGGPDTNGCAHDMYGDRALVLRLTTGDVTRDLYGYYDWCRGNGFDDGTTKRALTPESCQALWGGRLTYTGGSPAPFSVCHLDEVFGPAE